MSNKKTLEQMSTTEAKRAGVTSLADRPNDKSRYGDGGLTAAMLKGRFDALPNLVREKFNKIAEMLAGTDAAKYITLGGKDNALGETLFDFLALFGPRYDGITDKNISDLIETLYQGEDDKAASSRTLREIVASICARLVALRKFAGRAVGDFSLWVDEEGRMIVDAIDLTGYAFKLYAIDPIGKAGIGDGAVSFEKLDAELGGRIVHAENFAFEAVSYNAETGVLTFKAKNGGEKTVDLPLELLVKSGYFDESERDVVLVLANGGEVRIPFDAYVEKVTEELKRIDDRLPSPSGNDGRFLTAKGGKLVFSDIGESRYPKLRAPISATTDSRGMKVTVENREAPFILKNHVYIDGERVGTSAEGESFDFSAFVGDKIVAEVGVTAASEGFAESDKTTARWGLTNGDMDNVTASRNDDGALVVEVDVQRYDRTTVPTIIDGEPVFEAILSPYYYGEDTYDIKFPTAVSSLVISRGLGIDMMYIPGVESASVDDGCTIDRIYSYDNLPNEILSSVKELSSNTANGFKRINTWCVGVGRGYGYEYAIKEDGTARLTYSYITPGEPYDEVIPSMLDGLPVNGIGKFYKYLDSHLTSVTFSDNIEDINDSAFRNCSAVTSLKFGKGLKSIGEHAFRYSGVTSLDFSGCPKLETINGRAFSNCSKLASVKMSSSVKTIGSTAFASCSALKDIYVPWSEGEVAGAPWGATGATIHYNSEV